MTDKPRKPTPTEQAAMDARPGEPDASGDPRQTWPTQRWRDEVLGPPKGGGEYTPDMADKQQPAQRHESSKRLRDQAGLLKKMDEVAEHRQTSVPTQKLLIAAADALDAQAVEIAELRENLQCSEALRNAREFWWKKQNVALREALEVAQRAMHNSPATFEHELPIIDAALEASDE